MSKSASPVSLDTIRKAIARITELEAVSKELVKVRIAYDNTTPFIKFFTGYDLLLAARVTKEQAQGFIDNLLTDSTNERNALMKSINACENES